MKRIFYLFIFIFSLTVVHATEFSYELNIIHTLEDDESFSCELNVDGKLKNYKENTEGYNVKSFDNDIKTNLKVSCSQVIDRAQLFINLEDNRVFHEEFVNIDSIDYNLTFHEAIIKIYGDNTTCILNKNSILEEYSFDGYLMVDSKFFKTFNFKCDDEVESMEIKINDNRNKDIYYDLFEDLKEVNYNSDNSISKDYNTIIYLSHTVESNIKCTLTLDGGIKQTKTFTKDTKRYNLFFESKVGETIDLSCDDNIDIINVYVDDRRWDRELIHQVHNSSKGFNIKISENIVSFAKVKTPLKPITPPIPNKPVPIIIPTIEEVKEEPVKVPSKVSTGIKSVPITKEKSWWSKLWDFIWS